MKAFACMMGGRYRDGVAAGRAIADAAIRRRIASRSFDRWRVPILYEVHNRFGHWQAMLDEREPPDDMPFVKIMWRFERTIALAALGDVDAAEREHDEFRQAVAGFPLDERVHKETAPPIFALAELVMQGEMAFHRGEPEEAVTMLRRAVAAEDALEYYEPPLWHLPARHALGAVLVTLGRHAEAEQVYRADLQRWPNNGWSLHGLHTCLRARGATAEADRVKVELDRAWAQADTEIGASCLCVLGR